MVCNTEGERPSIDGLQLEYNVGETVNANCTSSKMTFHTHLIWYINKEQVNKTSNKYIVYVHVTHNAYNMLKAGRLNDERMMSFVKY